MRTPLRLFLWSVFLTLAFAPCGNAIYAQTAQPDKGGASPVAAPAAKTSTGDAKAVPAAIRPGQPPGQSVKPGEPAKSSVKPGKSAKSDKDPKPVKRPEKPPVPPKPEELKVLPDEKGKVRINFNGQPWPAVLEWLARISDMSLDWQELPGDYLNLTTQRSYTVQEARDMINRHLLARGYTLLRQGELLTVANIKKLDPSFVPRLEPEDLEHRDPNEFVKVSFPLEWLVADTAVNELKPMLSPNGKLTALAGTNRLEARDAVINLREIYAMLKEEQSTESRQRLVREFKLRYARASEVRDQLQTLLGIEQKPAISAPKNPAQAQQAAMIAKMQQAAKKGKPGQPSAAAKPTTPVAIAVNEHLNSLLVYAPPDKMAIIVQAVEAIDMPTDRGQSLVGNMSRMQVYRLVGVDPEPVVKTLEEMGNLDPTSRLEVDKKSKAIIAYASLADHVTIRTIVEKLSGSERNFHVRRLRRLPADYVAGTIQFMMGGGPKKKQQRSPYYWRPQPREEPTDRPNEFRIDADVEHNRLLLLANEIELAEVDNLLVKLGEISAKGAGAETVRMIDVGSQQEREELLERIRRAWPSVAPNPLLLPPAAPKKKQPEPPPKNTNRPEKKDAVSPLPGTTARQSGGAIFQFAELRGDAADDENKDNSIRNSGHHAPSTSKNPDPSLPPVKITVGADGRIIISSDDTEALDRFEELASEFAAPRKEFKFFRLKYAWAYDVAWNLEEFFQDEKKEQGGRSWWWGYNSSQDDTEDELRLSKRRKLKFIADSDMKSILVVGADPAQLKTIAELIDKFDQPPPKDSDTARRTEVIPLRYAKAEEVAAAVKDVYRDLLSTNDKALANAPGKKGSQRTVIYDWGSSGSADSTEQKAPKFKGLLSIGVDDSSNTLIVSAPVFLFDPVSRLIQELDEAASDNAVRVVKVGPGITADRLQEVLDNILNPGSSRRGASAAKSSTRPRGRQSTQKNGQSSGSSSSNGS